MLNRIIIINSEIYAKGSITIGDTKSIQFVAENNVGKSSFLNALNFLYIIDKEQMRFEDNRKLSDSIKHYFDGTSLYSFIVFEIFKNGYYNILVKATPENTIEYYRFSGEFNEDFFIQTSGDGFKVKKWDKILQELTNANPTDPPALLKGEELYNLVYNSDKNKNPVVWIKRDVKRKGRAYTNSFTDIYKHLIKTSLIDDKSFKNALLVADNRQDVSLNVFKTTSFDKINEFEKKKNHLNNLIATKTDFESLKFLNDKFISEESVLGKLKNTFIKNFSAVAKDLSEKIAPDSSLSLAIGSIEHKIDNTLRGERDALIAEKSAAASESLGLKKVNGEIEKQLKEVQDYDPTSDNLLYQGLINSVETDTTNLKDLESKVAQVERSQFTYQEVERAISNLTKEIGVKDATIQKYSDLLCHNISKDPETVKRIYSYLNENLSNLDKSKIIKAVEKTDSIFSLFDGKIDVSGVSISELPTISQLEEEKKTKQKELAEKKVVFDSIKNSQALESKIGNLRQAIKSNEDFLKKIRNKPALQKNLEDNRNKLTLLDENIKNIVSKINLKDNELKQASLDLIEKRDLKKKYEIELQTYQSQYRSISGREDIYQIEEILDESFEQLFDKFERVYLNYRNTKEKRKELKDSINDKLKKDIQDVRQFIREVDEEIKNIPEMDKVISSLLDTLSHEIGSPTHSFLSQFNDFKTFVYKSYNSKLAEYPVSNIQSVKVKIIENDELISDLNKISSLKFSNELDFDNSYSEGKEALSRQVISNRGRAVEISDLFTTKVEITKITGETEEIDLSKQVQSRGTNVVLKLYLFLNIIKDLVNSTEDNKVIVYIDELDVIGQKNVKYLIRFCIDHHFVPIFAAPRKVDGIHKYYVVTEPKIKKKGQKPKITFGDLQSFPVAYRNAE